jgi:soluble lytic murein transglycosylase
VMSVRSSAGAQGLMQLMPATAKWVAKRIGLKDFSLARVADMDTNVTLGTHYLSIVYSDLGNDPVLASAAYNAGPGRARRWRDSKPLEAAIYIESIPFNETRDYVKKVMSNAVFYAAQFEGKPQSLKARLGNVRPANGAEVVPDTP